MRQVGEEGRNTVRSLRSSKRGSQDLEQALSRVGRNFRPRKTLISASLRKACRSRCTRIWDEVTVLAVKR